MRVATLIAVCVAPIGSAVAQAPQPVWQEFSASQSRVEFAALGLPSKPTKGWELQGGSGANNARNYQYLWGMPFQGGAPFARVFLAQIKHSGAYFTAPPQWEKVDIFPEFSGRPVTMASNPPVQIKTDGFGGLGVRRFSVGGRDCVAFGGLTSAGSGSQLLSGEAMASGDTSVRGHVCAGEGASIADSDLPSLLGALRFK